MAARMAPGARFEYSWAELDTKGTRPFNFAEQGIGPDERRYRISYIQLAVVFVFVVFLVGLLPQEDIGSYQPIRNI
jgi:hypothetical protein